MPDQQPDHRWYEQAKEILQRVLDLTPGARSAYLTTACGDNAALRAEVESLLAAHDDVDSRFLDSPPAFPVDPEPQPEDIDLTGKRIGAYRLERLLGQGGMGAVYLASRVDGEFSKHVAIKFIRTSRVSPDALKRFKVERQILADIDHPNIARLIDGGTAEGMPFFIMEYVAGDTLAQALDRGPLPIEGAVRLAIGVADVLEAIHAKGLVIRDLKPSNIILNEQTGVKILDFGIAKLIHADTGEDTTRSTLTGPGVIVGSPKYMSPEQAAGEEVDARSDVFSFGLVMFEALTGHLPFAGTSRKGYRKSLIADPAEALPLSVPARLRAIVEQCLRKDPAERFRSGHELANAVRALSTPVGRFFGGRASWIALVILALAVGAFGVWTSQRPGASNEPLLKGPPSIVAAWGSNENNPRISPDMKWVSFISDRDGQPKIWLHSRPAGTEQSVAPSGGQLRFSHEWAPTSDWIAYLASAGGKMNLVLAPIAGGTAIVHELPHKDVSLVRWLPGGVYYLTDGSLWRFDLGTAKPTEVSTGRGELYIRSTDVSADERHLVFSANVEGTVRVWLAGLDARNPIRLTEDRILPRYLRWKGARAREVVFISEEGDMVDIWQMDISSKVRQRLTATEAREGGVDVSMDGAELVYQQVREEAHLATFSPGEGKTTPTRLTSDSLSDLSPSASATGRDLVFQRAKGIMTFGMRNGTIRVSSDGFRSEPRVVGEGYAPEISPDGRWVVYPEVGPAGTEKLWLVDLAQPSRKPWLVTDAFLRPKYLDSPQTFTQSVLAWSSQGSRLYFRASGRSGGPEVWTVEPAADVAETRVVQLTDIAEPSAEISDLRLSADGRRISYLLESKARAVSELHVYDLARNKDSVQFTQPAPATSIRLACPGWLWDDSIVILRGPAGDSTLTDVILVKDSRHTDIGSLKDATWGSATLDPRQRILFFGRDIGVHSLIAWALDVSARPRERALLTSEPNGDAFSGIRVSATGQLLFALQSLNIDILSYRFVK